MFYLYDNSHSSSNRNFERGLKRAIETSGDAELFLENVNFSSREKNIKDRIWKNFARGNARLEGSNLVDSENHLKISGKDVLIAKCVKRNQSNVKTVDTGPIFPDDLKKSAEKVSKAQESNKEIDMDLFVNHIVKRDILTARYISKNCQDPTKTTVIMGSAHNLDALLSQDFKVKGMNKRKTGTNSEARQKALKYLKKENYL